MDQSFQERIDRLRVLSEPKPAEYYEKLTKIQKQTKMIAEIVGVLDIIKKKKKERQQEREMSFEQKRQLYQAEFPNKVSLQEREKAREALKYIAHNPELLVLNNPEDAPKIHTSRSWPSSVASEESLEVLTTPKVEKKDAIKTKKTVSVTKIEKTEKKTTTTKTSRVQSTKPMEVDSRFNGTWKFGFDNFAQVAPPEDEESPTSTVYDGMMTPIQFDPELATPLHTCTQED